MRNARKLAAGIAALAVSALGASGVRGGITLQLNVVPMPNTPNYNTLAAAGWHAIEVVAVADAQSIAINGFDFRNAAVGVTEIPGIYGTFLQRYGFNPDDGTFNPTPVGPVTGNGLPAANSQLPDTFWVNFPEIAGGAFHTITGLTDHLHFTQLTEEFFEPGTPNINRNASTPLTDNAFSDWGIGSEMHAGGSFTPAAQTPTKVLAYLIVPHGSQIHLVGQVLDATGRVQSYHFNTTVTVPESATLGVLGLSAVGLLLRKRRVRAGTCRRG